MFEDEKSATAYMKADAAEEDYGPLQKEVMELRKRAESLHLSMDRLGRKLKPVLRGVPDTDTASPDQPRPVQAQLTEIIGNVNRSLGALDMRMADMVTQCEL